MTMILRIHFKMLLKLLKCVTTLVIVSGFFYLVLSRSYIRIRVTVQPVGKRKQRTQSDSIFLTENYNSYEVY